MRIVRALAISLVAALSSLQVQAADAPAVHVPKFERIMLDNGATLLLMERHDIPLVSFEARLKGGALADPDQKWGAASLTAKLLEKGAGARNAFAFADAVADVGGNISAAAEMETLSVSGEFLSRDQTLMIQLLADMLLRPRLDAQEFESLRNRQIETLHSIKDSDLSALVPLYGSAFLFGQHPYAHAVNGSEQSLAALTYQDIRNYYTEQFGADRLILAVSGDFQPDKMKRLLRESFGSWKPARAKLPEVTAAPRVRGRRVLLVDAPSSVQTYFWIGNVGLPQHYPERAALDVTNTLFGVRFTSMLNSELRIRSGLTYGARSTFVRRSQPGPWYISSFTRTEATVQAVDLALATLDKLKTSGVPADALESGKRYVIGQFPLALETASQWADQLTFLERYGFDRRYIEDYGPSLARVDPPHVQQVINDAYPAAADVVVVLIGNAAKLRDDVKKYGPVTEMKLSDPRFAP